MFNIYGKRITIYSALLAVILIIISFLYTYFYYQFWTHVDTRHFKALIEYNGKHLTGFRGRQILVHNSFMPHMKVIESYAAKNNVEVIVIQSYRPPDKLLSNTVVKPAVRSNHLVGYAIDFNLMFEGEVYTSTEMKRNNYKSLPSSIRSFLGSIKDDKELRWGGDFYKEDPVHIDVPLNKSNKLKWKTYRKNCAIEFANAMPVWRLGAKKLIGL